MVTRSSRRGFRDWVVQRLTAVIIGIYAVFISVYLLLHPNLTYIEWHGLLSHSLMQAFTFIVLLSILRHTWIGLWTVFTDYIKNKPVRLTLEFLLRLTLLGFLLWMIDILWIAG